MSRLATPLPIRKVLFAFVIVFGLSSTNVLLSQCSPACESQINVSINDTGFATITPDLLLINLSDCNAPFTVEVFDPAGNSLGNILDCSWVDIPLQASVTTSTGQQCMGTLTLEDKRKPVLTCQNDTLFCNAPTTPTALGIPSIFDNCDPNPSLSYLDEIDNPDCQLDYSARITRTWTATDQSNNVGTCVQTILITRANLSEVVFPDHWDGVQNPTLDCTAPTTEPSFTGSPTINGLPIDAYCELMVFQEDEQVINCPGDYIIQRTWKVYDWCSGNVIEQTQIIKVVDETGPIINCPNNLSFGTDGTDCTGTVILSNPTATDDCSNPVSVALNWAFGNGAGTYTNIPLGTHQVDYTATDACGNTSTCSATLEVIDDDPPVAICQTNLVVALNADTTKVMASAFNQASFDNCALDTSSYQVRRMEDSLFTDCLFFSCADLDTTIMVVFQVCDTVGLCNSCMIFVTVQDKTNPVINCPPNASLNCSDYPPDPLQTGMATATDNCGIDSIYFADVEDLNSCNVGTITRTWTAVDRDGRTASCQQLISIGDTIAPIYNFPADLTVACLSDTSCVLTGKPNVVDDCGLFGIGLANETVLEFTANCSYKILREWFVQDQCTLFDTSYTQLIIVKDSIPPVWDQVLGSLDSSFACSADLILPNPPTATDICNTVVVSLIADDTTSLTCAHQYTRTLIYQAIDDCGNASFFPISLTVLDTIPPTATALPDLGPYNCYLDIPGANILDVLNETDNCAGTVNVNFVSDSPDPGCTGVVIRTYQLSDLCGNTSDLQQQIFINDTIAPTAAPFPSLASFACYADLPPVDINDVLGLMDNCSDSVTVVHLLDSDDPGCSGTVTRSYQLTDLCNNSRTVVQTFIINDTIPPSADPLADLGPIDCYDNIPANDITVVTGAVDNCGGLVTVSFVSDGPNPGCTGIVQRAYALIDDCGNADTIFQNIIILDDIAPTADALESLGNFACYDSIPAPDINLVLNEMDNCDSLVTISFLSDSPDPVCGGVVFRTYQSTDICGNTSQVTQTAWVNDSIPPVITCPADVTVDIFPATSDQCQSQVNELVATAIDNCGAMVSITNDTFPTGGADASGFYPVGTTRVTFTATDNCNNTSTCSMNVTVRDISPPNPSCNSTFTFNVTPGQTLTLSPNDFDNGTTEECSNFEGFFVSNDGSLLDSISFDCSNAGVNSVLIRFYNDFDRFSVCFVSFFINCNGAPGLPDMPVVGGTIFAPASGPISNVSVYVSNAMNEMHDTENAGQFLFENIPLGSNLLIEPKKNDDLLNGISSYDLVLIAKHLLNIERLLNPYQLIAADVDRSGDISVFDLLALRKAILHLSTSFPNNESWRFMNATHLITDPTQPFSFPESQTITNLTGHDLNLNFRGIKIGDVNLNAIPNALLAAEVRNPTQSLFLTLKDQVLIPGEKINVKLRAKDFQAIQALQGSFEFDPEVLAFSNWDAGALAQLDEYNFGWQDVEEGLITWSWFDLPPQTYEEEQVLFSFTFEVKQTGQLADFFQLGSRATNARAYKEKGTAMQLDLQYDSSQIPKAEKAFILYPNTPNPFSEQTQIRFYLPSDSPLTFSIYDEVGRRIHQNTKFFQKGEQQIELNKTVLPHSGIYFYQLQSEQYQASEKMIFIQR